MSLKPPKKGDLKKSWLKPRRDTPKKIQPEYHLITTEGISTEPAYFQGVKNTINSKYRGRVQLDIIGVGDNTLNLLQKVKQKVAKSSNIYKHVWIVYDTDDFPAQNIDKVVDLCHTYSNEETTYHALWSNQCIELWFLLHFSFIHSDLHRQEYWAKLSSCLAKLIQVNIRKIGLICTSFWNLIWSRLLAMPRSLPISIKARRLLNPRPEQKYIA